MAQIAGMSSFAAKRIMGISFLLCFSGVVCCIAQKNLVLRKGRGYNLVLPPFFANSSRCLPLRVSNNTPALLTCATPSQPTAIHPFLRYSIYIVRIRYASIRCEARGCIRNKLSMHLSSTGYFLFVPLILTSSRQSHCFASIKRIIVTGSRICQL